ncbi:MAG TPA: right-handed parallel beta-helix repeat-containing protein, partial [Candidatus Limnocylindrales bacterium]|nr:right-handed parallel beta-helix repeat-containing protein [Candidatus Limnocylindrales bacterium]
AIDAIVLRSVSTLRPSNPIDITTDNVTIDGVAITSSGTTGIGIVAEGTAARPIRNITIRNCSINGFSIGIEARHVENLVIDNCAIANADYAGIAVYSGVGGRITNNVVRKIGYTRTNFSGQFGNNAYGIALDHYAYGTLTADPYSSGFVVDHNTVEDVPLWMCFNVHAAQNTTFSNNTSGGCPRAFFIAGDATGHPSRNVTVTRNLIQRPVTKPGGTADIEGVLLSRLQGGAVTYNQIARGYSPPVYDYLGASTNVTISGNTVIP